MKTFEQLRKYIKENIPDPFSVDTSKAASDFDKELKKTKSKGIKTYKQKSLDLYKSGGPFVPEKEVSQKTGKTVKMEKKPYFGKKTLPQKTQKAPDRTGLKKAISDVRAGDKRLYDAGVGKKPSLVQQRKYTKERIKQLSRQTTLKDRLYGSTGSTEGSAGASGAPKKVTPTKPQKSASAKDFTKKINQANKNRKEFTGNKKSFQAFKKQADAASDKLVFKREAIRSNPGTKDVKQIRDINKKIKSTQRISKAYDAASKGIGKPNAPVVASDLKTVTDNTAKVTFNPSKAPKGKVLPPTPSGTSSVVKAGTGVTPPPVAKKKVSTGITKSGNISYAKNPAMKLNKTTQAIVKRETSKALKRPENVKYAVAAAKRKGLAKGLTRFVGKLGPKGRLAATVLGAGSYLASKPGVRKFVRNAAIGTGLAGALGFAGNKEKVLKKGDGLKPIGKVDVRYGLTGTSKKGQGGKVYDPKQMAKLGKVQKNFIDKYNQKASRNPFKKQIQYKAKGDGTYKILDPKKK